MASENYQMYAQHASSAIRNIGSLNGSSEILDTTVAHAGASYIINHLGNRISRGFLPHHYIPLVEILSDELERSSRSIENDLDSLFS